VLRVADQGIPFAQASEPLCIYILLILLFFCLYNMLVTRTDVACIYC
jgi:hypothetical protein